MVELSNESHPHRYIPLKRETSNENWRRKPDGAIGIAQEWMKIRSHFVHVRGRPPPWQSRCSMGFSDLQAARQAILSENYGKLPLSFERNMGQSDRQVKFLSRGNG
jgi:hypothetical protein